MPLITGSSGQLGSYLVDRFRTWGRFDKDVRGVDLLPSLWTTTVGDVRNGDVARSCIIDEDVVIHCAAQVSVKHSVESPLEDASHNIDGTLKMLDAARRFDAEKFVYISSAAAYGSPVDIPIGETHPTSPQSPYGLSKLTGERYTILYHELYALPVVVLRPFNIYSVRQDPENPYSGVISNFARRIRNGEPPRIFGDGQQTRDFVHALDVVQAVETVVNTKETTGHVFNVGTGRETSINELATLMLELSNQGDQTIVHEERRPGDIRRSLADIQSLKQHGYEPEITLSEGISSMI